MTNSIVNDMFDQAINDMEQAINQLELTQWFMYAEPPDDCGFIFWDHPNMKKIKEDPLVVSSGHSGSSFGYCCRSVQKKLKNSFCNNIRMSGDVYHFK